jgi:DNA invertase Pin-like site-specific DNA recombinase
MRLQIPYLDELARRDWSSVPYRSRRGSRVPPWFADRIQALAAEGVSGREIARRLGTSQSTASRVIRRMRADDDAGAQ